MSYENDPRVIRKAIREGKRVTATKQIGMARWKLLAIKSVGGVLWGELDEPFTRPGGKCMVHEIQIEN